MKKILTSVFILACCMGGGYGDSICSYYEAADCSNIPRDFSVYNNCYETSTPCQQKKNGTTKTCGQYVQKVTYDFFVKQNQITDTGYDHCEPSCYTQPKTTTYECVSGYYASGNVSCTGDCTDCTGCQTCPAESTSSQGAKKLDDCMCNDPSKYIHPDTKACIKVPDNADRNPSFGTKFLCHEGYYQAGYACTKCTENATTQNKGSTSINDCKCKQGYYMNNGACEPCPEYINTKDPGYNEDDPDNSDASAKVNTTTTSYGAKSIQECYIPQGIGFCDEKGCGTYTGNAYHN